VSRGNTESGEGGGTGTSADSDSEFENKDLKRNDEKMIRENLESKRTLSLDEITFYCIPNNNTSLLQVPSGARRGSGSEADSDNDFDDEQATEREKDEGEDSQEGRGYSDGVFSSSEHNTTLDPGETSSYGDDERTEQDQESDYGVRNPHQTDDSSKI